MLALRPPHAAGRKLQEVAATLLEQDVLPGDLTCSACRWAATALRAALVERMPKRVKQAQKRRVLAAEVMVAGGEGAVCAARRFPRSPVVSGDTPETLTRPETAKRKKYSDLMDIRKASGMTLNSEHFKLMESSEAAKKDLARVCRAVTGALAAAIVDRAEAQASGRIFGAVTDRWLCVRAAQLCDGGDVPATKDDGEEEEEEEAAGEDL